MVPIKKVEDLINKHSNLEKELSSGNVDKKLFAEKSKEYSDLNEIIKEAKDYISFEKNKNDLEKIINDSSSDKEIKEIAYIELQEIIKKHKNNEKKIKLFLLPKDEYCLKMRQTLRMQSLKLELAQEDLKLVYLHQIYSKCMRKLVIRKSGLWR